MTQRKEHSWNEWDYENRRTPVWVSRNSTSVRYRHDVMSSTREDVIRRRHVLLRCADSNLNHEWSKTASFASCLDACLDAVGVRPPLSLHFRVYFKCIFQLIFLGPNYCVSPCCLLITCSSHLRIQQALFSLVRVVLSIFFSRQYLLLSSPNSMYTVSAE
jgi:hypothetical protein